MFKSNNRISSTTKKCQEQKPYNYIDIPTNIRAELYPRKRKTEFYFEPSPQFEYQTHQAEHPKRALQLFKSSLAKSSGNTEVTNTAIFPPTNSTSRMARDSYFS